MFAAALDEFIVVALRRRAAVLRRAARRSCLFVAWPLLITAAMLDAHADQMESDR